MKINKRVGAAVTASALVLGLLVSPLENIVAAVGSSVSAEERTVSDHLSVTAALPDSAELEKLYIEQLFYGEGISLYKDYGETALSGATKELYSLLKTKIKAIADGTSDNTSIQISMTQSFADENALSDGLSTAVRALMADMPASFYWYDKTVGNSYSYPNTGGYKVAKVIFEVSEDYRPSGGKTETVNYSNGTSVTFHIQTDSAKIKLAQKAALKAQEIAASYEDLSDYEKVMGYRKEICELTDYNDDAAADANMPYGDPWQLVYVFDGDPNTKVVCEGYSKAFQYLCDLGGVECYTVGGWADASDKNGSRHMWNIVVMDDGKSYLVDVTYSDGENSAGENVILKGAVSSDGTRFTVDLGWKNETREYYPETISMYPADILTVSTTDYTPPAPKPVLTVPESAEAQYGDNITIACESQNILSANGLTAVSSADVVDSVEITDFNAATGAFNIKAAGIGAGKATVTVTYTCEDGTEVSAECELTVHKWEDKLSYDETHHWYACEDKACTKENLSGDHTMTEAAGSAKEATCTEAGKKADMECSVCGYTKDGEVIAAKGHTKGEPVQEDIVDASCTEAGSYNEVVYCTDCKQELSRKPVTGQMLPHKFTEVPDSAEDPTCVKAGKEADKECSVCGLKETGKAIPATGKHTADEPVQENKVDATCTKDGSYNEVIKCKVCGTVISTEKKIIEKTGHTNSPQHVENEILPTCTDDGSKDTVIRCTVCDEIIESIHNITPALGHNFSGWITDGTGHRKECQNNDCKIRIYEGAHTEDGGTVILAPTETANGARVYSCTVCGTELKTEDIPMLGEDHAHSFTVQNSDALSHWNECVCGEKNPESVSAHNIVTSEQVQTAPTCCSDGFKLVVESCADCGRETNRNAVMITDRPAHTGGAEYFHDTSKHWQICEICGMTTNEEPHEAAPNTAAGSAQTCIKCGYEMAPAVKHIHTPVSVWSSDAAGHWHDCGTCSDKLSFTAHTEASEVTKNPTETTAGTRRYYCPVCGYTIKEEIIPASGADVQPARPIVAPVIPTWINSSTGSAEPLLGNGSGKTGWESIADDIRNSENGSKVYVDMNGTVNLSKTALRELAGKNVDLVLEMNDRITWTINGETVTAPKDVNMRARLNTNSIPQAALEDYTEGNSIIQLTLSHRGSFGFEAVMTVDLGSRYNGKYANLLYYNQSSNELEFIDCSLISDGKAELDFSHASEYAVVISDEPMGDYEDVSAAAGIYEDSGYISNESGVYAAATAVIAIAAAIVIFRKRIRK